MDDTFYEGQWMSSEDIHNILHFVTRHKALNTLLLRVSEW